jgi:hypothetical protein
VSDLPAGRELDALVAEKVMGICVSTGWEDIYPVVAGVTCVTNPIRPYSTDIAAAWEVVEKALAPKGYNVGPLYEGNGWWVVQDAGCGMEIAIAETAPLAICLAALNAVSA